MHKKETAIVFTGDIGFDRYMDRKWEDEELLSREVLDFFHSADHVCANVEGALIDAEDDGSRGVFFHAMNPSATKVLKNMHADIWSIGNNHTMDAGAEGIVSTRKIAAGMGYKIHFRNGQGSTSMPSGTVISGALPRRSRSSIMPKGVGI